MKILNMTKETVTGKDYLPDAPDVPTLDGITKTTRWINFWILDIISGLDNLDHWT